MKYYHDVEWPRSITVTAGLALKWPEIIAHNYNIRSV